MLPMHTASSELRLPWPNSNDLCVLNFEKPVIHQGEACLITCPESQSFGLSAVLQLMWQSRSPAGPLVTGTKTYPVQNDGRSFLVKLGTRIDGHDIGSNHKLFLSVQAPEMQFTFDITQAILFVRCHGCGSDIGYRTTAGIWPNYYCLACLHKASPPDETTVPTLTAHCELFALLVSGTSSSKVPHILDVPLLGFPHTTAEGFRLDLQSVAQESFQGLQLVVQISRPDQCVFLPNKGLASLRGVFTAFSPANATPSIEVMLFLMQEYSTT